MLLLLLLLDLIKDGAVIMEKVKVRVKAQDLPRAKVVGEEKLRVAMVVAKVEEVEEVELLGLVK